MLRVKRERIGNLYEEGKRNEVIGELAEFLKETKEADHNDGFLKDQNSELMALFRAMGRGNNFRANMVRILELMDCLV